VPQSLESLATIESHVEGVGKLSQRKVEEFAYEASPERVQRILGVDQVLRVKRVNLADGEPFAVVTVWCTSELGAHLSRRDVERRPFYELLDVDLHGATQTIAADLVDVGDAGLLGVPAGSPVLRCQRVTTDRTGRPVLVSEHVFPAHRTEFVVDLPQAEPSMTPSGLRIVD
jgi:GntR family transcriptional regulator